MPHYLDLVDAVARGFAQHIRHRADMLEEQSLSARASDAAEMISAAKFLRALADDLDEEEL